MSCERNQMRVANGGPRSGIAKTTAKTAATMGPQTGQAARPRLAGKIAAELTPLAQAFEAAGFQVEEATSEAGRSVIELDAIGAHAASQVTLPSGWLLTYPTPEARQADIRAAAQKPELTMYKFPRSTALESAGYGQADQALYLKFRRGQVYRYAPVEPEDFRGLLKSPSKGKFFQAQIRGRGIPYEKVSPEAFEALVGPQKPAGDEVYRQIIKAKLQNQRQRLAPDAYRAWVQAEGLNTRRQSARTYLTRAQAGPVGEEETSRLTSALKYGRTPLTAAALLARSQRLVRRAKQLTKPTGFQVSPARVSLGEKMASPRPKEGDEYTDAEWDTLRQIVKGDVQNLKEAIEDGLARRSESRRIN
jgi:hypothetical protein